MAESKGAEFCSGNPKKDFFINFDRRALTQIIINLANNALKFTEKGKIELAIIKETKNGKKDLVIQVIDTGIGIKPEDQKNLFQAFQQVANSGKRIEGTGLGLHLSQKLANLIKGQINFESRYGKGSCFSIHLPLQ